MDLSLNEEQSLVREGARKFLARECPSTLVREMEQDRLGYSPDLWKKMADLGWIKMPFTQQYGGEGMGFLELALIVEQMGAVLLPSPFITTITGGLAIMKFGTEEQKKTLLASIGRGELIMSLAIYEPNLKLEEGSMTTRTEMCGDGFLLFGNKTFVPDLHVADKFLCVACTPNGVTVFIVDTGSSEIKLQQLPTMASDKQWEVSLKGVRVNRKDILGEEGSGWQVVESILQWGACLLCAYMAGAADKVVKMTTDYAKQREQFGRPIGSFQAIQHKLADMLVAVDGARLITYEAAWKIGQGLGADFEVAAAKSWTGTAFQKGTEDAMRVFASIGYSMECDIQLYYRSAAALQVWLGDPFFYRERVAQLMGI